MDQYRPVQQPNWDDGIDVAFSHTSMDHMNQQKAVQHLAQDLFTCVALPPPSMDQYEPVWDPVTLMALLSPSMDHMDQYEPVWDAISHVALPPPSRDQYEPVWGPLTLMALPPPSMDQYEPVWDPITLMALPPPSMDQRWAALVRTGPYWCGGRRWGRPSRGPRGPNAAAASLCLVRDGERRCHCLRLYGLGAGRLLWEQELRGGMGYGARTPFFHTFTSDSGPAGLNFADEGEAAAFEAQVQERHEKRQLLPPPPHSEVPPLLAVPIANPDITASQYAVLPSPTAGPTARPMASEQKKGRKKISKADIGAPSSFKHVGHIGWDPHSGFNMRLFLLLLPLGFPVPAQGHPRCPHRPPDSLGPTSMGQGPPRHLLCPTSMGQGLPHHPHHHGGLCWSRSDRG
ncbi:actin nucleation-promoting factor WAS [Cuculus canorus]|uniref:actin nucleation-promoting factor WAS n=1 Tax=Cuculus canorus TaxID=55661 RepID=UPI0023AA2D82|nr:actin nucleation-promoting factor WAS [Cuculus canorus]